MVKKKRDTSWNDVAEWYDTHLVEEDDTYQKRVILPNVLRILGLGGKERLLDLACGQGFFSREFDKTGARVTGCDISKELIDRATARSEKGITYHVASAEKLLFASPASFDAVICILALQNIENLEEVYKEVSRVLTSQGRFIIVLNHPAFRIPKSSNWGWDEEKQIQFRRIEHYLSSAGVAIEMHPGSDGTTTFSFHRSLQEYFKAFAKSGFAVVRLEEWISHKQSERGVRQRAENTARKEIPLF